MVDTWVNKPSPFFSNCEDERLMHVSIHVDTPQSFSLGLKRNICTHVASGIYVAHFDDDDIYAPRYLETMLQEMCEQGWDAITLGTFYIYEIATGKFGHVNPRKTHAGDPASLDSLEYGYGFSYMYTRDIATTIPFPDVNFEAESAAGEDWPFFQRIRRRTQRELGCLRERATLVQGMHVAIPGPEGVALLADDFGLCLHVMHSGNTAEAFADREVAAEEAEMLEVRQLEGFEAMLRSYQAIPGKAAASSLVPALRERRAQELLVRSAAGKWWVCLPAGSAINSLRLEFQRCLRASLSENWLKSDINFYFSSPESRKPSETQVRPLHDQDRIPLRTREIWAAWN